MSGSVSVTLKGAGKGDKIYERQALARSEDSVFVVHDISEDISEEDWVVSHRATCLRIPRLHFDTEEEALAAADRFAAIPGFAEMKPDPEVPGQPIGFSEEMRRAARALRDELDGLTPIPDKGDGTS